MAAAIMPNSRLQNSGPQTNGWRLARPQEQHHRQMSYCMSDKNTCSYRLDFSHAESVWNGISLRLEWPLSGLSHLSSHKEQQRRLLLLGFVLCHKLLRYWLNELLGWLQFTFLLSVWREQERKDTERSLKYGKETLGEEQCTDEWSERQGRK